MSLWRYFHFPPKYHCVEKTGWCMKCEYKIWSRFHIQHIKIISKTRNNISVPRVSSVKVRMWFLVMRFRMVHYFVNMKILFSVLTTIQDLMTLCVRVETLFNYDHLKCKPNHWFRKNHPQPMIEIDLKQTSGVICDIINNFQWWTT